jgi:hypothetical protein
MTPKAQKIVFLLVLVVIILHQDFWFWTNKTLVFDFLPIGLVYHGLYTVLAAVTMWILVKVAWPKEFDDVEGQDGEQK